MEITVNYGLEDRGDWRMKDTYLNQPKQRGGQALLEEETVTWVAWSRMSSC